MYRYEYVTYRTGGGFWMDNSACEHREIIDEYAAKGWRYVGYLPTMFSGEGGTKEVDITMTVSVYPGRVVRIVIADKGVGIPDIPRAMEPLFTTGNPEERSGLGFAVMQSFMDKVSVRSAPGRGTRVTLTKHLEEKPST